MECFFQQRLLQSRSDHLLYYTSASVHQTSPRTSNALEYVGDVMRCKIFETILQETILLSLPDWGMLGAGLCCSGRFVRHAHGHLTRIAFCKPL